VFTRNVNEIYALVSEEKLFCSECVLTLHSNVNSTCGKIHLSFIIKYSFESNTWEDISSFDLASRTLICLAGKDNFVYFLGGYVQDQIRTLKNADRLDLSTNRWEKIADLRLHRQNARGVAAYDKIFTASGGNEHSPTTCEVYHDTTNEWQLIASMRVTICDYRPNWLCGMECVDGKFYVLNEFISRATC